ncbi:hypothetical protein NHX12_024293 [Muraenolepis orangiensis]|uniref:Transcription regulator Myc N-terminal domain-containing protein n=1 Tax=Muraenolepis orangiensis TaxID=630683 RepID=A0A9Q0EQI5_9TELE|nr:hypothetical protein NHX12_024293 [Muraenolepis orangiensis]
MPGISSTTSTSTSTTSTTSTSTAPPRYEHWDMMEYDHYQHYFYDGGHDPDAVEDFFKSTAPSEDIWKKFELVPTPPMSPVRTVEEGAGAGRGVGLVGLLHHHHHHQHQSLGDKLERVSQFLDDDADAQDSPCKGNAASDSFSSNLSSIIIQDCMWSGFSAGQQLREKVVCEERLAAAASKVQTGGPGVQSSSSGGRTQCAGAGPPLIGSPATECVDPAAVLTLPLTGPRHAHRNICSLAVCQGTSCSCLMYLWSVLQPTILS